MDLRRPWRNFPMALSLLLLLAAGCGSDDEAHLWASASPPGENALPADDPEAAAAEPGQPADGNRPPVAVTAAEQRAKVYLPVRFDASASFDPDGDPLRFAWSLLSEPEFSRIQISDSLSATATFTPLTEGEYRILLTVSDGRGGLAGALVTVIVEPPGVNLNPVALAGPDQAAEVGRAVHLDGGASFDPDGPLLFYDWRLAVRPPQSLAFFADPATAAPFFVPDLPGTYRVQLTVRDPAGASGFDTVVVTVVPPGENLPPVARAGDTRLVSVGTLVVIDGRGSFDPEGEPLFTAWTLQPPSGSMATLTGADTPTPSFATDLPGIYRLILTVRDLRGAAASDTALVIAR